MTSTASGKAKNTLLGMLSGWLKKEKQQKQWEKVVEHMEPDDLERIHRALKKEKAPPSGVGDSLKSYTRWYTSEKKKRADFLQKLPVSSPAIARAKDQLHQVILRGGDPLSKKEIEKICSSEKTFTEYLISLSVEQLETFKQALENDVVNLDPKIKTSFMQLFAMVQEDRFAFEKERMEKLGPEISRLNKAIALRDRLMAIEKIRKSLSSSRT